MTETQAAQLLADTETIIYLLKFGCGLLCAVIVACVWRYL